MCRLGVFSLFMRFGAFVNLAVVATTIRNRFYFILLLPTQMEKSCLRTLLFRRCKGSRNVTVYAIRSMVCLPGKDLF